MFKRLETDEEFRARAFVDHLVVTYEYNEMVDGHYGLKFPEKRRAAVLVRDLSGANLDDIAWLVAKTQRRIVEDAV